MSGKKHVTGIGGVFFKASDPKKLSAWYAENLGFDVQSWGGAVFRAQVDGKPADTVWSPFAADTKYFAPSDKPYMINLRVVDLAAALADLRAKGANVLDRGEESEQGKFGYVVDLDGNLLELWEPAPE
jgi:predicted enzyme related to lactoylglutathione lyase